MKINVDKGDTLRITFLASDFNAGYINATDCALANAIRRKIGGNPFINVGPDTVQIGVSPEDPNKIKFHILGRFSLHEYELTRQLVHISDPGTVYKDLRRI